MSDATSLLYDLPGFRVVSCEETLTEPEDGSEEPARRVVVMQAADEHGCPRCGVLVGGKPYDVRESTIKDLPMGHRPPQVVWRKRRYRCPEPRCSQRVFHRAVGAGAAAAPVDRPATGAVGAGRVGFGAGACRCGR